MAQAKDITESKTTYMLEMKDGERKKVTVPSTWKVTFGPICPGSKDGSYNSSGGLALRFYEGADAGKGKQHAVFVGVASFRDTSIEIQEEITETKQETLMRQGENGGEHFIVEANVKTWRNPDMPNDQPSAFTPAGVPGARQLIILK